MNPQQTEDDNTDKSSSLMLDSIRVKIASDPSEFVSNDNETRTIAKILTSIDEESLSQQELFSENSASQEAGPSQESNAPSEKSTGQEVSSTEESDSSSEESITEISKEPPVAKQHASLGVISLESENQDSLPSVNTSQSKKSFEEELGKEQQSGPKISSRSKMLMNFASKLWQRLVSFIEALIPESSMTKTSSFVRRNITSAASIPKPGYGSVLFNKLYSSLTGQNQNRPNNPSPM